MLVKKDKAIAAKKISNLLLDPVAQKIIEILKENPDLPTTDLRGKCGDSVNEQSFYTNLKKLTVYGLVERKVGEDRRVRYRFTKFGERIQKEAEKFQNTVKECLFNEI